MKENTEQDWVERAKQREPAAIAELYRRYWRAARATAYGVMGDLELAEDAASEAFYAAIDSLQDLKDTQRFSPWLHTIVLRTAKRLTATRSKKNSIALKTQHGAESPTPSDYLEQQEIAALIQEAVSHLSENLREAMSLFYFEGYSLKQAARFLNVPEGTLKRRLHEARLRLRETVERFLKGTKTMNPKREKILQQLKNASKEGIRSEAFFQAMRQALRLRPVPNDLLRKVMQKHWAEKLKNKPMQPEKERMIREALSRIYSPSERARDPNHPVGAVANAIRAALPEFRQWQIDLSKVDISRLARHIFDGKGEAFSFLQPPDFAEGSQGSYISATHAWLIKDENGSVCTYFEIMQNKNSKDSMMAQMKQGARLSDAMCLLWKQAEPLELRTVEELLRRLSDAIIPNTLVSFCPYEEPRYRAALRMQLSDNPIPAAIGGVHNNWPGIPDRVDVATVLIYLEPWAAAQSGQTIELHEFSPFYFFDKKKE